MIRINLLAEERGKKGRPSGAGAPAAVPRTSEGAPPYFVFGALLFLFVAVAVVVMAYYYIQNTRLENKISAQRVELQKYEGARQKVDQLEKKKVEFAQKLDQITQLKEQQSLPVRLMNHLVEVLPEGAWYTSVAQTEKGGIKVEGLARSIKTISTYYDNVVAIPDFVGPQMGNIKEAGGKVEAYSFVMTFDYRVGGAKPAGDKEAAPPSSRPAAPRPAGPRPAAPSGGNLGI